MLSGFGKFVWKQGKMVMSNDWTEVVIVPLHEGVKVTCKNYRIIPVLVQLTVSVIMQ